MFRPHRHGHKGRDLWSQSEQDYHSACTVRLVRSTSVLLVGEQAPKSTSTLKRSKSTVSVESTSQPWQEHGRMSLSSQNHLEYLEALMDLRRQYTKSMDDSGQDCSKLAVTSKKKRAPPPPKKDAVRWPSAEKTRRRTGLTLTLCHCVCFPTATAESGRGTVGASCPGRGKHPEVL